MAWQVTVLAHHPVVELVYSGTVPPADLSESVQATMARVRASGCMRVLCDCSLMEGGHSFVDLFSLVESITAAPEALQFREAIVLPEVAPSGASVRFWEMACSNRGLRVSIFMDRPSALAWLLAP